MERLYCRKTIKTVQLMTNKLRKDSHVRKNCVVIKIIRSVIFPIIADKNDIIKFYHIK